MPEVFVYKVPDGLSPERAVLAALMSVFYGLDKVVTHRFGLADAQKALKKSMEPDAMKVVIAPQEC